MSTAAQVGGRGLGCQPLSLDARGGADTEQSGFAPTRATPGSCSIHGPQRLFVPGRPLSHSLTPRRNRQSSCGAELATPPTRPGKHAAQRLPVSQFGMLCAERWTVNGGKGWPPPPRQPHQVALISPQFCTCWGLH